MSHRADEKERRRQERLAAEEAAKKSADRRKRLGLVGAIAVVAAVVVFGVFVLGAGDGDDTDPPESSASVPPQKIDNLSEAVRASGCTLTEHRIEGRGHTG